MCVKLFEKSNVTTKISHYFHFSRGPFTAVNQIKFCWSSQKVYLPPGDRIPGDSTDWGDSCKDKKLEATVKICSDRNGKKSDKQIIQILIKERIKFILGVHLYLTKFYIYTSYLTYLTFLWVIVLLENKPMVHYIHH